MRSGKLICRLNLVALVLLVATPAVAKVQAPEFARESGCLMCHAIDHKLIGPAFAWIADKYKDDPTAGKQTIIERIANGSSRQWVRETGGVIMPPMEGQTSAAQRAELADFILGLEPVAPPH